MVSDCIVAALVLAAAPSRAGAQSLDTDLDHWMAFAPDAARLGELTIPGSHDSGALFEPFPGTAIFARSSRTTMPTTPPR
jgi:hypothetical protein